MTTRLRRFAMKLKALRVGRKLSQAALAKRAGLSREYLARLEAGQQDPSLSTLTALARALTVRVARLVEEKGRRP